MTDTMSIIGGEQRVRAESWFRSNGWDGMPPLRKKMLYEDGEYKEYFTVEGTGTECRQQVAAAIMRIRRKRKLMSL